VAQAGSLRQDGRERVAHVFTVEGALAQHLVQNAPEGPHVAAFVCRLSLRRSDSS